MKLHVNGITIEAEDSGGSGEPVLLIMGLNGQLIHWPDSLLQGLTGAGHRVLRFDNRDAGLSTHLADKPAPRIPWVATQAWMGLRPSVPYRLADMAADALGVLDALGLHRAHIVGLSMGAMIAQRVALAAPERVRSLTCIMGSSGGRGLMKPKAAVLRAATTKPRGSADMAALEQYYLNFFRAISSPTLPPPESELRAALERTVRRGGLDTEGTYRQLAAILADDDRAELLSRIACPTLVMHGAEDTLLPMACGEDTARRIPGARLEIIADMAHDLVPAAHPEIVRRVLAVLLPFLAGQDVRQEPFS
ncbi:MAG: alpha/beta hydrolase [Ottowia sp.]|uniref:alpha/beta fold hydrolase n=1 Tax=Ottowia sp. TaxID=1898956 RepID=UPI003C745409